MDKPINADASTNGKWRADPGTNWVRYRGQGTRGKPKLATVDVKDLDLALAELVKAEDLLLDLCGKHIEVREAMALLDLAARFVGEVRTRRNVIAKLP